MRDIVKITEPGGHILDPFSGSGTTALAAVRQTVQKNFAVHGLRCVQIGPVLSCTDCGNADDFANLWTVIMALLRTEWFPILASSCIWQDNNGVQEDLLAQAGKLQGRKVT